ncbi:MULTISPECIES: NIPSNAP family protein [unclassified Bradyrhizobium]|uniref:NIPSNAP family protein n=1 Tax=unclassified Bradyrhizobium TaxID=2631580 RepID=UPI0028ED6CD5|nr:MULTISPECIES: NIPSNAP family protein [unclassified Bradyrhizobium]
MIHQLRIYEIFEHNKAAFHARFRDHAARIMRMRHGFQIVAMWESRFGERTEFVYVLEWPDEATKIAGWAAFMADAEWSEIKRITHAEHGLMVGQIEDRLLTSLDYSPAVRRSLLPPDR